MNEYTIAYKITTVAELIETFEYKGFVFSSYDEQWWNCDAWVASKNINAKNFTEALIIFKRELLPLIEMFSVISQCAFRFQANSFFIYKLNNNDERIIFINYVRATGHTGLHFDKTEIAQIEKIDKIPNKHALIYVAEAANVSSFYPRLVMLLSAIEGLAGEVTIKKKTFTNSEKLKEILGDELHSKLYSYKSGLRNILIHGKVNKDTHYLFEGLTETLYEKILDYLKSKHAIQFEENVVHPMRNFHDNFEEARMFEQFHSDPVLNMKTIESEVDEVLNNNRANIFSYATVDPKNY